MKSDGPVKASGPVNSDGPVNSGGPLVTSIGQGVYRVVTDGRSELVYVAGTADAPWAFWNGHVFHPGSERPVVSGRGTRGVGADSLTAPMPATVRAILVQPGTVVAKGDTLILVEAMKMELPLRATRDGVVARIHCREGDLVQPDTVLIELT